jgi:hypothetical protein
MYDIIIYNYYINDSLYNGTILDGKLTTFKNYNVFMIIDIYYCSGNNTTGIDLLLKLNNFDDLINNNDKNLPLLKKKVFLENINNKINTIGLENNIDLENGSFNDFLNQYKKTCDKVYEIKISKYVLKENIEEFINNEINESCVEINGLVFMSSISGIYYIYSNKYEFNQLKSKNNLIEKKYSLEDKSLKNNNLLLIKKSQYPSHYEIFDNNNNFIDLIKINNNDFYKKFDDINYIYISKNEIEKYRE